MRENIAREEIVFRDDENHIIRKIYLDMSERRATETIWFGKDAGTT